MLNREITRLFQAALPDHGVYLIESIAEIRGEAIHSAQGWMVKRPHHGLQHLEGNL